MTPGTETEPLTDTDTERLRGYFADVARDVTPSPVPLAAIRRAGRARRRRGAGLAVCCGLALAALTFTAVQLVSPARPRFVTVPADRPAGPAEVVPGGTSLLLPSGVKVELDGTGGLGMIGSTSEMEDRTGESTAIGPPGFSVQFNSTSVAGKRYLTGFYFDGTRSAARIEITTTQGTFAGQLLHVAGKPQGLWYAQAGTGPLDTTPWSSLKEITVYDAAGHVTDRLTAFRMDPASASIKDGPRPTSSK